MRMLCSLTLITTVAAGLLTGCGGGHEPAPAAAPPKPQSSMPALAPAAAATPAATAASASPATPAPPPAIDFTAAKRPLDNNGNPLSDLDILNEAIMSYGGRSMGAAAVVTGSFKTPEEQVAAMSKQYESQSRPLQSLSDLVKAGLIKALPQPPPGKQYVFDPKTQRAALVDKK